MGYGGKYTQVKEAVKELLQGKQEVFMPLSHRVGEAQVDFGYALGSLSAALHWAWRVKSGGHPLTENGRKYGVEMRCSYFPKGNKL
jgi:hypothetical protein